MLFNSVAFAVFLPTVFVLYWALPHKYRWPLILAASCWFYMSWNPAYILLILLTTLVSYSAALGVEKVQSPAGRKWILTAALFCSLGVLFLFKYFNFLTASAAAVFSLFSLQLHPVTLKLLLPVGISFYTFQTLSYVIDVYRGKVKAEKNFGVYAAFISFFPQLVAGPIERTENLLPQITSPKTFDYEKASYGLKLMAWGFFKKLAIADALAVYVDEVYAAPEVYTGLDILMAILFFTVQIYCDFSAYSDIAIGCAKLLGIDLMTNFRSPYTAASVKDFWSRWHISLSTWFRDYVYIPLGGNRCSKLKRDRNLMITFLASGLWHGANWTYVIWGGIHGLAQVAENRLLPKKTSRNPVIYALRWALVFAFCNAAWVFFRAETLPQAWYFLTRAVQAMLHPAELMGFRMNLTGIKLAFLMIGMGITALYDIVSVRKDVIDLISRQHAVVRWCCYLGIVWFTMIMLSSGGTTQFIYFQF